MRIEDAMKQGKRNRWDHRGLVILGCLLIYALFLLVHMGDENRGEEGIAILGFHNVVRDEEKQTYDRYNMWVDSASAFEEKIRYLYEEGYVCWSLEELYEWWMGEREKPDKVVVLTFDDGYYASAALIAPILEKYGYCGSTFVIGSMLEEEHTWDGSQLQFLNKADMEDQRIMRYYSHTYRLHDKKNGQYAIDLADHAQLQADFDRQKGVSDCSYVAYPYGYYNDEMISVLKENHVKLAFGYHENRKATRYDDPYQLPRFSIHAYTGMDSFRAMLESGGYISRSNDCQATVFLWERRKCL